VYDEGNGGSNHISCICCCQLCKASQVIGFGDDCLLASSWRACWTGLRDLDCNTGKRRIRFVQESNMREETVVLVVV
jgi:hypothetical protein